MLRLDGVTPVMAACFREDESVDDDALRDQIDAAIDGGAAAICGPGFGSEFYKLSDAERYHFVDVLVRHVRKRVPTIAGATAGSTRSAVEFALHAQSIGADSVMVAIPRIVSLPVSAVINHYSRLCMAVDIPVMLQDADFGGSGLPAHVFIDIAEKHPSLAFVKLETALAGQKCSEVVKGTNGAVQVVYGLGGVAMLDGLAHGASAVMPSSACVEVYVRVYRLYKDGHYNQAQAVFTRLLPFLAFAQQHLEVAVYLEKRILQMRGILPSARMRQPTVTLDSQYEDQVCDLATRMVALCAECSEAIRNA